MNIEKLSRLQSAIAELESLSEELDEIALDPAIGNSAYKHELLHLSNAFQEGDLFFQGNGKGGNELCYSDDNGEITHVVDVTLRDGDFVLNVQDTLASLKAIAFSLERNTAPVYDTLA